MSTDLLRLTQEARQWAEQGVNAGWLTREDVERFCLLESHTPENLFEREGARPLVVAFFGGTGVGKSSLLNRLAGQPIARTGVERPTSREVSVFLHEAVQLHNLPGEFPLEKVKIIRHQEAAQRHILWVDMPDMDSIERANRDLVLAWLAHIDVLVYVVSPERYRDEKAWRLLLSHGREHAWLFVLNQWDRAQAVQLEDFAKQLALAGFADPVILKTDSRALVDERLPDDFPRLAEIIQSLCDDHTVKQLEQRSQQARYAQLTAALDQCLQHLRGCSDTGALNACWDKLWEQTEQNLLQGLQWPMQQYVQAFVARDGNPLRPQPKLAQPNESHKTGISSTFPLWDDWAQSLLADALDRIVIEAAQAGLSRATLKNRVDQIKQQLPNTIMFQAQQALRLALANPGNLLQRYALRFTAFCSALLPIAALSWVGYQALIAYQASAVSHANYLGTDFAVHSGLLIAIAWLLPWFIHRQLAPSAEKAALKGLRLGIFSGLATVSSQINELLSTAWQQRQTYLDLGAGLSQRCQSTETSQPAIDSRLLVRLLQQ